MRYDRALRGHGSDWRGAGWHGPGWSPGGPHRPGSRIPAGVRLWLPVIVSFLVQVPAVFVGLRFAQRHLELTPTRSGLVLALTIALIGPVALIWARRFPAAVVAIVAAAASVDLLLMNRGHDGPPYVALAFALVSAIVRGARIWAWLSVSIAGVATLAIGLAIGVGWQPIRMVGVTLGVLLVMGIGEAIRTRREQFEEVSRRIERRKQTEVQAERVRIARELHDVLAHSLSQINVQASVALHLMEKQPEQAALALASIKDSSKTALDEVRAVLGVLRAEDGADPSAPLVPEPDLSRLDGLVSSMSAQGVDVTLRNELTRTPPAAIQLAFFRIAQESLTNVMRHAAATAATIVLQETAEFWQISVQDNGSGAGSRTQDTGGRGVLGMRERAELLGGTLEAGPAAQGGFLVVARIPLETDWRIE